MSKRSDAWAMKYAELKSYIELFGQLPDKHKIECRRLLNWWKYNRRLIKTGRLDAERTRLITNLGNMRHFHL